MNMDMPDRGGSGRSKKRIKGRKFTQLLYASTELRWRANAAIIITCNVTLLDDFLEYTKKGRLEVRK